MAAVAYTDVAYTDVMTPQVRTPAQVAADQLAELHRREGSSDPVVDGAARLLCIPLRQVYALAWRAGFLTVS